MGTISEEPVISARGAEMCVLDRAVLQAAAIRRVRSKKQTFPKLSVQAAKGDRIIGKSLQNIWRGRSETQRGTGIGRFDNHTGIDCEIAARQIGGGLRKPVR